MKTKHARGGRSGQVVILAPVLVFVLAMTLALTVDVGQMLQARAALQNAADAACLAAVQTLVSARDAGDSEADARTVAQAEAAAIQQANSADAGVTVEFGCRDDGGVFSAVGVDTEATAVRVTAFRNDDAPGGALALVFTPIVGLNSCAMAGKAVSEAAGNIKGYYGKLSPFAVPQSRIPDLGDEIVFYPAGDEPDPEGLGGEVVAPGNWGLLDLNGGANSTSELADWILNGFDGGVLIGDEGYVWIYGIPGFRTALQNEIQARIGDEVVMVVYDEVVDEGANAHYRCVGFVVATITECDLTGGNPTAKCRVEKVTNIHDAVLGGSYTSPNMRKTQLVG